MDDLDINIRQLFFQYIGELWPRRWLAITIAWIFSLGGFAYVASLPDLYTANARIFVDTQSVLQPLMRGLSVQDNVSERMAIMRRTLLTRPNIERVITETNLDLRIETLDPQKRMVEREELIDKVRRKISVRSQGNSLFAVGYSDRDAEVARDVAQAVLNLFREQNVSDRRADITSSRRFIDRQIEEYERRLIEAELRVAQFRRNNAEVLQRTEDAKERVDRAKSQLRQLELERQSAIWRRDQTQLRLDQTPRHLAQTGDGGVISAGGDRCAAMAENRQTLLLNMTEEHPQVRQLDRLMQAYGCFGGPAVLGDRARLAPGRASRNRPASDVADASEPAGPDGAGDFGAAFPSSVFSADSGLGDVPLPSGSAGGSASQLADMIPPETAEKIPEGALDAAERAVGQAVDQTLEQRAGPLAPALADQAKAAIGDQFAAIRDFDEADRDLTEPGEGGARGSAEEPTNPEYIKLEQAMEQSERDLENINQRIGFFEERLIEARSDVEKVPEVKLRLNQLNRDYDALKSVYNNLIERREKARLAQNLEDQSSNVEVRIVEPPILPVKPSGPDRVRLTLMVLVAGVGIGVGAALALAQLNNSFRSLRDLKQTLSLPVLGGVSEYTPGGLRRILILQLPFAAVGAVGLLAAAAGFVYTQTALGLRLNDFIPYLTSIFG